MRLGFPNILCFVMALGAAPLCTSCGESTGKGAGPPAKAAGKSAIENQKSKIQPVAFDEEFEFIRIEAESGRLHNGTAGLMRIAAAKDASGGKCIEVPEKAGNAKRGPEGKFARAVYKFAVRKPGHYTFWCRRFWRGACSDTFAVRFDKAGKPRNLTKEAIFGADDSSKPWHWGWSPVYRNGKPRQFYLRAGQRVVEILNREDGPSYDVILLTNDPDYVPTGLEEE